MMSDGSLHEHRLEGEQDDRKEAKDSVEHHDRLRGLRPAKPGPRRGLDRTLRRGRGKLQGVDAAPTLPDRRRPGRLCSGQRDGRRNVYGVTAVRLSRARARRAERRNGKDDDQGRRSSKCGGGHESLHLRRMNP